MSLDKFHAVEIHFCLALCVGSRTGHCLFDTEGKAQVCMKEIQHFGMHLSTHKFSFPLRMQKLNEVINRFRQTVREYSTEQKLQTLPQQHA